ncbi:MAG: hypothetical protein IPM75_14960 [Candidatus Competibacteraceae bacterium]|nr:hypothetical protein [Candidatus Competibacteraceae bacterium]
MATIPQPAATAGSGHGGRQELPDRLSKKYNELPPSIWAVLAGDGFRVLGWPASRAPKSTDGDKIAGYLHKDLKNFSGKRPDFLRCQGDREGEVYRVYKVGGDGKFVLRKL